MKVPWFHSRPPKQRRLVLWSVGLLAFYTLFGFLILPLIVRAVATKQLTQQLERETSIAKVLINPYTFSTTIRGLLIKDKDGQPFVAWEEVHVNFQLSSFLGHPWVFKEIRTTKPFVRVQVNKDYTLNFSDLIAKFSPAETNAPPPPSANPPDLRIDRLRIAGATASFTDLTPRQPFTRTVGPLEITLENFHTHPDNENPHSFTGTTDAGETIAWHGQFFLDPIRSRGELSLENFSLNKYAALYQDFVGFEIKDGTVSLRAAYEFVKSASNNVIVVTNVNVALRSFKLAEPAATNNLLELDHFAVTGASLDALGHRAEVGAVTLGGGRLQLRRNQDASINLVEAAKPAVPPGTNAPGTVQLLLQSVTNVFAQILSSTNAWQATVHVINVEVHAVQLEDLVNTRPVRLTLDAITLHATNLSNLGGSNFTAVTSLRWNTNGTIATAVDARLFPMRAEVRLDLDRISLAPVEPYLEPFLHLFVTGGEFNLHGSAQLVRTNHALPEVAFRGEASVEDFATVDRSLADDLLKWKSLRVSGIDARLDPPSATIGEIALLDPVARLIIQTNRTINLLSAARMDELNPLLQDTNAPAPAARKTARKVAQQAAAPTPAPASTTNSALPKISIATVAFTNASFQFADRSIQPFANLALTQLTGLITGLSTEELQRANVNLRGRVDNTAPVEITGQINPLTGKAPTDLKMSFKDIDLHPTGPYSGKFLGYRLNKGKLGLELNYHIAENRVKAQNVIIIDQLTLGEKVASPDATKLPVRLALAVLKDRNGRIELDVPIEGSLDDPQFKLGKVITRTLLNIITKIATSPFAALGAVFGGKGEELSFQEFNPGGTDLTPATLEKLNTLVKGLYERPGLQVEIEGSIDPAADRTALARRKLEKELRQARWKALRQTEQARLDPAEVTFTPEEYQAFIRERHAIAFSPEAIAARGGKSPATTNPVAAPTNPIARPAGKGAAALLQNPAAAAASGPPPQELEAQLIELEAVPEADYAALAVQRAQQVKTYLQQTGMVEASRLFLTQGEGRNTTTNGSRVYLRLQ